MTNVRHILGISGGKDSAALAVYLKQQRQALLIPNSLFFLMPQLICKFLLLLQLHFRVT